MTRLFERIDNKKFFFAYFFVICLYLIFQRLRGFPQPIAYIMYAMGIFLSLKELCGSSLKGMDGKLDVFFVSIFSVYYFFSSLIYAGFNTSSMSWLFKDWLYSLLPIVYYLIYRLSNRELDKKNIIKFTLLAIIILDIVSLITFVVPDSSFSRLFDQEKLAGEAIIFALNGIVGVIGTGFINVIGLCICLLSPVNFRKFYKIILSSLFIICAFLSGQRTPIGGILIVFFFFVLKNRMKGLLGLIILCIILAFGASKINIEVGGYSVIESITDRTLSKFDSFKSGESGREDQRIISENGSAVSFIIGEGVGKYSPENPEASVAMPDAMLYRIYNEMGVLGLLFFIIFFLINLCQAIKTKNYFMVALIIYVFFANYFNRVLFTAPISIIPYFLIAAFNWEFIALNKKESLPLVSNK